jgi:trimeric autotransporter adhesin
VARNINERGPGEATSDVSLFKTFHIVERLSAQFRVEALNAFNTPYFSTPNTTFGTPTFGKVTSQFNYPRLIQLGIRVIF